MFILFSCFLGPNVESSVKLFDILDFKPDLSSISSVSSAVFLFLNHFSEKGNLAFKVLYTVLSVYWSVLCPIV